MNKTFELLKPLVEIGLNMAGCAFLLVLLLIIVALGAMCTLIIWVGYNYPLGM